jgi:putative spermidine/putrescine transport system permease protein
MTLELNGSKATSGWRAYLQPAASPAFMMHSAYLVVVCLIFLFMLTPVLFVFWVSVFDNAVVTFPPQGYSLRWFVNAWENSSFLSGFLTSVRVGMTAMIAGLMLGIPASFALTRGNFPGRAALNAFLLSPLIVPGIVAGTAVYTFFVQIELWTGVRLIATLPGFVAAHVALTIPWTVRLISASLIGFDRTVEEAAMSLGARPFATLWHVTLPMIRPGVVAAAIFSFIVSFTDLEMSLFLAGPGRTTLQIAMLQYLEWKFDPTVAAVSVVQIALIGACLLITDRFVKLSKVV